MKDWDLFLWPYQQAVSELKVKFRSLRQSFLNKGEHSPIEFVVGRVKTVDHAEQTIKVKETNLKEKKYSERVEINDLLSVAQAEQMTQSSYEGDFFLFGGDVGNYLQKHYSNEAIRSLKLISWSQTRRILANGPENCELTLDLTEFPDGYYDFELEIENDDPDTIKKVLSELEKQFNFTANKENTNQSKVQRAWEHKK